LGGSNYDKIPDGLATSCKAGEDHDHLSEGGQVRSRKLENVVKEAACRRLVGEKGATEVGRGRKRFMRLGGTGKFGLAYSKPPVSKQMPHKGWKDARIPE